jgi:hypothetical protein
MPLLSGHTMMPVDVSLLACATAAALAGLPRLPRLCGPQQHQPGRLRQGRTLPDGALHTGGLLLLGHLL